MPGPGERDEIAPLPGWGAGPNRLTNQAEDAVGYRLVESLGRWFGVSARGRSTPAPPAGMPPNWASGQGGSTAGRASALPPSLSDQRVESRSADAGTAQNGRAPTRPREERAASGS